MRELGVHAIVDAWGADPETLDDPEAVEEALTEAVLATGATIITSGSHQFEPQGVTAWTILAESHATVHTYPEEGRWMADVFTCGDVEPDDAVDVLLDALGGEARVSTLSRG